MWRGVPFCCGEVGGNPYAAARAAASHLQAVPWMSPHSAQPWGLCAAQSEVTWGMRHPVTPTDSLCHPQSPTHKHGSSYQGCAASSGPVDVLRAPVPPHHLWSPSPQACSFDLHSTLFFVGGCLFHQNLISTL